MSADVTVVITSSNRHDLLERTIASFLRHNTYGAVKEMLIFEDSARYPDFVKDIDSPFPIRVISLGLRIGQLLAIDIAYTHVTTEYIFHLEDDWEFYADRFIEYSKFVLETNPEIVQVHLREAAVYSPGKDVVHPSKKFAYLAPSNFWMGFSFNPGLRRYADYAKITSYAKVAAKNSGEGHFEQFIGWTYAELGYVAAILLLNDGKGFVRHTGDERHIRELQ